MLALIDRRPAKSVIPFASVGDARQTFHETPHILANQRRSVVRQRGKMHIEADLRIEKRYESDSAVRKSLRSCRR
jgi:hypothetical protein